MVKDLLLTKKITFNATADAVWDVLTNPEKIKLYLFGTKAISDWREGSSLLFTGEWEGKQYVDKGTILKFDKHRLFQYTYWSSFSPLPDAPENYSVLTFTLTSNGTNTDLLLEQKGFVDEKALEHSNGNWGSVLKMMKEIAERQ